MNDLEVKYHNDINKIQFKSFTVQELKVFFLFCAKLKDLGDNEVNFSFYDLKKIMGLTNENDNIFGKLLSNTLTKILHIDFLLDNENEETKLLFFSKYTIDKKKKIVYLKINESAKYLLNKLTERFTLANYSQINKFKSKYSLRLYTELKQFQNISEEDKKELNGEKYCWRVFSIFDFRRLLDIPKSFRMKDIDKRVLIPSVLEFQEKGFKILYFKDKKGREISSITFYFIFENKIMKRNEKKVAAIEICKIEEYWKNNFPGVNYTLKHKKIIDKLKKNNSIAYIKSYLQEQWDFVKNNAAIENRPAYFSQLILEEKAVFKDYEALNKKEDIDPEQDKIQAENFVGTLFENIEKNNITRDEEIKENKEIEQPALFLTEITQEEYDFLYQKYLENNELKDDKIQRNIFKMMNFNKYKIVEKKEAKKVYTVDDIPEENLLSKNGKKLVGAALQMRINKILEEMNNLK